MRIAGIAFVISLLAATVSCSGDKDDKGSFAREQANKNKPVNKGKKAEKMETAVAGGQRVPCDELFVPEQFTEALKEELPVVISDETKKSKEASSICGIVRGGERPDAETQKKMSEKTAMLGVLPGDQLCNIELFCWEVPTAEQLKKNCAKKAEEATQGTAADAELGSTYACEYMRMQGPYDRFAYEAVDPDTKCRIYVRGGPSMNEQETVKSCATVVLDQLEPEKLAKYRAK